MTNREFVYSVRNHFSSGAISDDFYLSPRLVLFYLEKFRAKVLYDDLNAKRVISNHNKQTICVPLIEVEENYCDCEGSDKKSCYVLRSKCPIPRLINNIIFAVDSTNGKLAHEVVNANQVKYKYESRIESNRARTYVFFRTLSDGTYLYLTNNEFIDRVILEGLFEEPREAADFLCCNDKSPICDPLDEPFYLDDRLVPLVQELTIKLLSTAISKGDILNNDIPDKDSFTLK